MNPSDRSNGSPTNPQRWLTVCVVVGLVAGAGGLLPSLMSNGANWPAQRVNAAERDSEAPPSSAEPTPAAMLGRLAAGTVLVLALCVGTLPLVRRWLVTSPVAKPGGNFDVIASLPLNGRCGVCLVRAGGQHLLAATDVSGLQILVPVGDVPAEHSLSLPETPQSRRAPASIEPRRLTAV